MTPDIFPYLVIGLAAWLQQERQTHPYPAFLQDSLNRLSLALRDKYPKTTEGVLLLLSQPLEQWWDGAFPTDFAPEEPLIEFGTLSHEALRYLNELSEQDPLAYEDSLAQIEIVVDNRKFKRLFERLRELSLTDPEGAQGDYETLRHFLIEHPYVRVTEISRVFSQTKYISAAEVGEFYVEAGQVSELMQYSDGEGHLHFWQCERCGPLYARNGQLKSVKPTVCGSSCGRRQERWQPVTPSRQLRVLRKGIHLRTHIPGVPELQLFTWLQRQRKKYPQLLIDVVLWPGIDMYDIQLKFFDEVWAVDVKDHHRPGRLGSTLSDLYREGKLHWNRGFYVYPAYRERQQLNYRDVLRQEAKKRLADTEIVSDEVFKSYVRQKIRSVEKGSSYV